MMPGAELVRRELDYDAASGVIRWKKSGAEAGYIKKDGYRYISISGVRCLAHVIAWVHYYGSPPVDQVDHENRVKSDNRITNLRSATHSQNQHNRLVQRNSKTGLKGVTLLATGRWQARIKRNGVRVSLGVFTTAELAANAYRRAAKEIHGEFAAF